MKENSDIYVFAQNTLLKLLWCLFVTGVFTFSQAQAQEEEDVLSYDSSIQRSNFFSINPRYEDRLEKTLEDRRTLFLWKLRFDGLSLQTDDNINSQVAGATFRGKFRYKLLNGVRFMAKGNLSLESGRSQSIFGDLEPGSGVYPREVKVQYEPFKDYLTLDVGMIHQKFFNQPLFIGNLGFIGASEKLDFKRKTYSLGLRLQQLIPTSYTRSTRVTEREEVPNFYTETLSGQLQISKNNWMSGAVTHYRYDNLPSVVAFDSFIYGNTVTNTDVNNARFIYEFDGFMTQLAFEQKLSNSLSAQVGWDTIKNNKAPSEAGEAEAYRISVANDFGRWILAARYKRFFIESDAVPAAYNSYRLGHNNRIGDDYELNFESKDWGVMFKASYTRADLLNDSTRRIDGLQQDNQQTIYFSVETMYDFI